MKCWSSKSSKFHLLFVFLTILFLDLTAQEVEQSPNILPPSPTAAELGKYGFVPVGMATGTIQASVPLYTYKTRNIEIPISLSYQSNGTKVDQIASWVGLNWSLEAGGVITRIVRDDPDENNLLYINDYEPFPDDFNSNNPVALEYLNTASVEPHFDTEPDIFAFNFLGHSGKFVFDRDGRPVTMPYQNLVIERLWDPETYTLGQFIITTPDGVRYTFGAVETSKTYQASCAKNYDLPIETAWYLTKIEHPAGDIVSLHYQSGSYFYFSGVSQYITVSKVTRTCPGNDPPSIDDLTGDACVNRIFTQVVSLQRIESLGYGTVEFTAVRDRLDLPDFRLEHIAVKDPGDQVLREFSFGYIFPSSQQDYDNEHTMDQVRRRMFLTSVMEKSGNKKKSHAFEYYDVDNLPARLSYAQDHWGYFNGRENSYLVPDDNRKDANGNPLFEHNGGDRSPDSQFAKKGMLSKITYPTGGYSEFQYQANTYYGTKTIYPDLELFELDYTIPSDGPRSHTISQPLTMSFTQTVSYTLEADKNSTIDPLHDRAWIRVYDVTANNNEVLTRQVDAEQFFRGEFTGIQNHTYNFVLEVSGFEVMGRFAFYYYPSVLQVEDNIETGGVRISKIINHDYVTGNNEEINYLYAKHNELTKSSGKIGWVAPDYFTSNYSRVICGTPCDYSEIVTGTLHSSSVNSLFMPASNNIYYRFVTVSRGPNFSNGVEEHEFTLTFDEPGQQVWGTRNIKEAPLNNFGWNNGLETYSRVYKKADNVFTLTKQVYYDYVPDTAHYTEIPALVIRKNYTPICDGPVTLLCDAINTTQTYSVNRCVTNHNHWWVMGFSGTRCRAPDFDNRSFTYGSTSCYQKVIGETATRPDRLDHLDAIKYLNISYWFYLKKKVETTYEDQGEIETVVEYNYDNPTHAQVTRQTVKGSDGKTVVTVTKYPDDYGSVGNMQALKDKHIVGIPIKRETIVGDNKVAGSLMKYNDNGQPLEVYAYEPETPVGNPPHNSAELIPALHHLKSSFKYNESGNVKEVVPFNSPVKSYLWGYDNTLPIAEIVNASLENVTVNFNVFHTSFEEDVAQISTDSRTGRKSHAGTYIVTSPKINGDYKLTYWEKTPGDDWMLKEVSLSVTNPSHNDVTIGTGTSLIDEVRLYPVGALMTTYTYDPLVGVTSVTDPNNLTSYYQYDPFGRLDRVKDSNGNLVKHYKYHYYNEDQE